MKPSAAWPLVVIVVAGLVCIPPSRAEAGRLGTDIPSHCVAHTSLGGGSDLADDYRCAGLAIDYHADGVTHAEVPTWAGQWLFTDEAGQFRVGSCTFNRGTHPNISSPSHVVTQAFPNDPSGALGAYLAWRHGDTTDPLTAAGLWVVFHYYAQDAGGSSFAEPGAAPLVSSLSRVAAASGRDDLQQRALDLHAEAERFAAPWSLVAAVTVEGRVTVTVRSGERPVAGHPVRVHAGDTTHEVVTGDDGTAALEVPGAPGRLEVTATTESPGPVLVYLGTPARPDPQGAQTLVTAGDPVLLHAAAAVDIPPPSTTTTTPTTTPPTTTTTTTPPTTSITATSPPTTTTVVQAAGPTTTTPPPVTTTTSPPPTTTAPLPVTGSAGSSAYLATAFLVAGIGLVGSVRRHLPTA